MKKIEKLTKEQEARFPEFIEKWTKIGLSTECANREAAEVGIRKAYEIVGKKPPLIVWCGSPMSAGLTRAIVQKMSKEESDKIGDRVGASVKDSVWDSVGDSVWASVWDSVWDSVRASVWDSVGDSVWDSVGDSVWDSVRDSVWDSVRASVWDSVGAGVRDRVGASVRDSVWASVRASVWDSGYGQHDANWIGFFDYFREALGLKSQTDKLEGIKQITENAGWYLPHENICWISERHNLLHLDDRGLLHREDGPALQYPDGWGIFAWHGTKIPEEWIMDRKSLTPTIALKTTNLEQRRAACEILGWDRILGELNAKTIEKDADPLIGELVEVIIPDIGKEKFLRVQCGTGRKFAMPVPPNMKTALQANAWTWGLEGYQYKPEIRT